jgi:MFS family permease
VLLDRLSRRRVLVITTLVGAMQGVVLALLVITDQIAVWHTYAFALIDGVIATTNQSARSAVVYDVSTDETFPNAVALNTMVQNLARVVGPPLTGVLIGFSGSAASAFIMIAVMASLAAWLTVLMRSQPRQQTLASGNPLSNLAEGFRYARGNRAVLGLLVITFIPLLLVTPYVSLLPVFAKDVLGSGPLGLGLLASALGWGSLIGIAAFTVLGSNPPHRGSLMLLGLMLYLSFALAFTQSTHLWLSFACLVVAGIFNSIWYVLLQTLIQLLTADAVRGRVLGVWQMAIGAGTLGVLPMGLLESQVGPARGVGLFIGTAWLLSLLVSLTWRSLREA